MIPDEECETGDIVHLIKVDLKNRDTKWAVIADPVAKRLLYINTIKGRGEKRDAYERFWRCLVISSKDYVYLKDDYYCISCISIGYYNQKYKNLINKKRGRLTTRDIVRLRKYILMFKPLRPDIREGIVKALGVRLTQLKNTKKH